jgi:hypothetical protein
LCTKRAYFWTNSIYGIRIWIKTGAVFEAAGGPLKAAVVTQMFIQQSVKFAAKMCYCGETDSLVQSVRLLSDQLSLLSNLSGRRAN